MIISKPLKHKVLRHKVKIKARRQINIRISEYF